ncbi:tetratricopeptide repeat protein [Anseongella ginsenosidimutans]|uniref:Tetratricopeptide repeat protein n=1 Tax=Anseongella ginsenosidimutans TaxID=496056 RepID=A0A4R3KWI4_9SPHI|nr:hypothetical protein [Anseongella ginsenosidimutans]QEC51188.1 hypothetical protein FRZ59_01690 [Anseongella ginsenosidimutans]TCS90139.1 tetratricopeptide repeat protein [Anseongella ginsenosidimutans]
MRALRIFELYRFPAGILLLIGGGVLAFTGDWGWAITCWVLGALFIFTHLFLGPMRLVQEAVEKGDVEEAMRMMKKVTFPKLLYKPIRSAYYFMQSNLQMANQDLDAAESTIRQTIKSGVGSKDYEGMPYFQLGNIAYQKNNLTEAFKNLRKSVQLGLPDKENLATAYLTLASISMNRRDFRGAKNYFRQAKNLKPTSKELVSQIREMDRAISKMGR